MSQRVYYDIRDVKGNEFRVQFIAFILGHGVTVVPISNEHLPNQIGFIVVRILGGRLVIGKVIQFRDDKDDYEYEYLYVDPNPIEVKIPSGWCGTKPNPNPFDMTKHRLPLLEILQGIGPIVQGQAIDEMKRE